MDELFEAARARGIRVMEGEVLGDNQRMLSLTRELGFAIRVSPEDPSIRIVERRL
jgi:acetyltransferase